MIKYSQLKEKPKRFLAATGLTVNEFQQVLPVFKEKLAMLHPPPELTKRCQPRQRRAGAGPKERLQTGEDKLLFILIYQKTYPIQEMLGLQFGISQPQANNWIHLLLPILKQALAEMGLTPECDGETVANSPLVAEAEPDFLIDGTERRRQRSKDAQKQREHYSGKKKAHTDKNLMLTSSHTKKVLSLSPIVAGKTHDKRMADDHPISYPRCSTLGKDTGFQGYERQGVITFQPKKKPKGQELSQADRCLNSIISGTRISVENTIAGVKRCRIVKDVFRNTIDGFSDLVMEVACGLHNLRVESRHPMPVFLLCQLASSDYYQ